MNSRADVFHLLDKSEDKTLCDLQVAPIIINRPAHSSTLYLTETVESAQPLCEKCGAIETEPKDEAP